MKSAPIQLSLASWIIVHRGEHILFTSWEDALSTICTELDVDRSHVRIVYTHAGTVILEGAPASWNWEQRRPKHQPYRPLRNHVATIYTLAEYQAAKSRGDFK